jgi:hypothetical protein
MTEQAPEELSTDPEEQRDEHVHDQEAAHPVRTGVPDVDRVLEDLEGLQDRPLEEHVGAFERAHEALRSALDAAPETTAETVPGSQQGAVPHRSSGDLG